MKILLLFIFSFLSSICLADGPVITGNTTPEPGSVETYTLAWPEWNQTYEGYANVLWDVSGGTVISYDKHEATIQWNTLQGTLDGQGRIFVNEDLSGQQNEVFITLFNSVIGNSATCEGILGPAAIAIDFGSGTNPGPPLASWETSYQYNAACQLNVNEYTRRTNTVACRGGFAPWQNIPEDHTPNDVNGYLLMFNGGPTHNDVYRANVTGLTSSFRYEFSAYVGNLYSDYGGQDPQIKFTISDASGNQLASSPAITIAVSNPFAWQKVGFMFDVPQGITSVWVVISNLRGQGTDDQGNDFVVDDISFAPCYSAILASFSSSTIVDKANVCNSGSVNLYSSWSVAGNPFQNAAFQWEKSYNDGQTWTDISGATTMNYYQTETISARWQYRVRTYESSNPSLSYYSNVITYFVMNMFIDPSTINLWACQATTLSLNGNFELKNRDLSASLTYTYLWSPSTYISNPNVNPTTITLPTPPNPGGTYYPPTNYNYNLTVTNNEYGCTASAAQTISLQNPRKVMMFNAFTPNGDGHNETFFPFYIEDYPGATFSIYNRFGQCVFYSNGPTQQSYVWDGKYLGVDQPIGVYVWVVELPGCPNNIYSAYGDGVSHGDVTIIR